MLTSSGARAFGSSLLVTILLAACGQPGPSSGASALTSSGAPASSSSAAPSVAATVEPSAPATVEPTPEPTAPPPTEEPADAPKPIDASCPNATDDTISVQEYVDATTSCFRYGVRVRGWLDTPPPLGFEAPLVKPSWIYYPSGDSATSLWHQPPPEPDHVCASGEDCWWFFPHPDPDLGLDLEPLHRWVILTGHTRDPRAQNCHYDGVGPNPNPELVTICGRQFVVTAIEEAP
jgi:hypothetical protein